MFASSNRQTGEPGFPTTCMIGQHCPAPFLQKMHDEIVLLDCGMCMTVRGQFPRVGDSTHALFYPDRTPRASPHFFSLMPPKLNPIPL